MLNELRYQVRSREIVDLYNAMRTSRLTLNPYFQRNLVWRDAHKRDFIDTILKGYPFPQIFLARGPIDLVSMEANQCVVDGQQRLNTIRQYIEGALIVEGGAFSDLPARKREEFLKYEVAVIDFDLNAGDPRLKDVFHRLNRTYYSLSAIEKISSEYSASEFLLVARVLCGEITKHVDELSLEFLDEDEGDGDDNSEFQAPLAVSPFARDPGIDDSSWQWLEERSDGPYATLLRETSVFTPFEFDRKVPLMFTLNVMCTYLLGYFNRNDKVRRLLEDKNSYFAERDEVVLAINSAASYVKDLALEPGSMWWNKANFFTLICELARNPDARLNSPASTRDKLAAFAEGVEDDYSLAAREAVGRKAQRELRGAVIRRLLLS